MAIRVPLTFFVFFLLCFVRTMVARTRRSTFIRALISAVSYDVFIQFLWAVPWCLFMTASPYCLNRIVQYVECEDCGPPTWKEYIWVFALFGSQVLQSLSMQGALHRGRRIYIHVTAICNSQIFTKTLRRKDMGSPNKTMDGKSDDGEGGDDNDGVEGKDGSLNIASRFFLFCCDLICFYFIFVIRRTHGHVAASNRWSDLLLCYL